MMFLSFLPSFLMRDTWSLNALPCSLCAIGSLLCLALRRCTMQLFIWHHVNVGVAHYFMDCLMFLVPCPMLLMMHHPHLHQPRLRDRYRFTHLRTTHAGVDDAVSLSSFA